MLITRYIIKEIVVTLFAVTAVLMFAFLSNQLVRYLAMSASGKLPGMYILKLMLLVIPQLIGLLLPLGFFVAILLSLGRLYIDNEMTVLSACGLSRLRLITIVMSLGVVVALLVGFLNGWMGPSIYQDRQRLLKQDGSEVLFYLLMPGHFQTLGHADRVVYIQDMARDRTALSTLFAAFPEKDAGNGSHRWSVLTAAGGHLQEKGEGERYFIAEKGSVYQGAPGEKDYKVSHFENMAVRLTQNTLAPDRNIKGTPTANLLTRTDNEAKAELAWRIALPVMTLILALLAVPLSEVKPRQGQYAKLFPATLILIAYANLLFVSRGWISQGLVSPLLGMGWLHGSVLLIALGLLWVPRWRAGWRRKSMA